MKTVSLRDPIALMPDGVRVMIGGFMGVGTPERLIDELVRQGKRNLTVIAECSLPPLTSARPVSLVVSELAVIDFADGRARLLETAPGVTVEKVLANTEASLVVPDEVPTMAI